VAHRLSRQRRTRLHAQKSAYADAPYVSVDDMVEMVLFREPERRARRLQLLPFSVRCDMRSHVHEVAGALSAYAPFVTTAASEIIVKGEIQASERARAVPDASACASTYQRILQ